MYGREREKNYRRDKIFGMLDRKEIYEVVDGVGP